MTEHARLTTSGNGLKITLTSGIIIAALVAAVGWGLQVQLALATKADGEQVKQVAKEEAATASASKASKEEVAELRSDVRVLVSQMKEQNEKLAKQNERLDLLLRKR